MMWANIQSINVEMKRPPKPKHPEAPEPGDEVMYVKVEEDTTAEFKHRKEWLEDLYSKQFCHPFTIMIAVIKPIVFAFLQSDSVKKLVIELLEAYAKTTDNTIDDAAVKMVSDALFPAE